MKKYVALAVLGAGLTIATATLANSHLVKGKVTKVDAAAQKVTIRHEAIKKFDMDDGMTMVFRVKDPEMLKQLKAGDDIRFDADKINGAFTVTEILRAK